MIVSAVLILALVAAVIAASLRTGFRAHPELWLPLVLVAAAIAGVVHLARVVRAAARSYGRPETS